MGRRERKGGRERNTPLFPCSFNLLTIVVFTIFTSRERKGGEGERVVRKGGEKYTSFPLLIQFIFNRLFTIFARERRGKREGQERERGGERERNTSLFRC